MKYEIFYQDKLLKCTDIHIEIKDLLKIKRDLYYVYKIRHNPNGLANITEIHIRKVSNDEVDNFNEFKCPICKHDLITGDKILYDRIKCSNCGSVLEVDIKVIKQPGIKVV